jgi:phosphoribosylformylglycinamidine cyclo-ligase
MSEGSYEAAGVSIERGERTLDLMRSAVEATHGPEVLGGTGGFAGLYALAGYEEPVLASTIDGVGTKVLVAKELGRYVSLGADIVNHCANDVLATGARPLLFLDYVASGRLDPEVRGAAEACRELGVALVGGETAEMPGLYAAGDLDVVGVCVGACERSEVVTGERVREGDAILGLASSGLHTNGYTLARKVVEEAGLSYPDVPEGFDRSLGELYLEPHRAYVREIQALQKAVEVRGESAAYSQRARGPAVCVLVGRAAGVRPDPGTWQHPRRRDAPGLQPRRRILRRRAGGSPGSRAADAPRSRMHILAHRGGRRRRRDRVCLRDCPKAPASRCSPPARGRTCRRSSTPTLKS